MEANTIVYDKKTYGIRIRAQNDRERAIIRHLWKSGAKLNATNSTRDRIDITFADLVDDVPIIICEGD